MPLLLLKRILVSPRLMSLHLAFHAEICLAWQNLTHSLCLWLEPMLFVLCTHYFCSPDELHLEDDLLASARKVGKLEDDV